MCNGLYLQGYVKVRFLYLFNVLVDVRDVHHLLA